MDFQAIWICFGVHVCVLLSPLRQTDTGWWQTSREHRSNIWQSSPDIFPSTKNNTLWWWLSYFTRFSYIKKRLDERNTGLVCATLSGKRSKCNNIANYRGNRTDPALSLDIWTSDRPVFSPRVRWAAKSAIHYIITVPVVVKHTTVFVLCISIMW